MPSRCCEFVDSRLRRSPPDRASAVPMDKPGKTQCVSPTLPTGRRLPHKLHSTPQQHGMILISGNGEITSRLYAFSLFFPGSCPNNRDRRRSEPTSRPAGLHLKKRLRLSHDRGPPHTAGSFRPRSFRDGGLSAIVTAANLYEDRGPREIELRYVRDSSWVSIEPKVINSPGAKRI